MKRLQYVYEVKACVQLTEEELLHLTTQASRHYDRTCRGAAQAGGFLYGMRNCLKDGLTEWDLTPREIDLMLKILEQPGSDPVLLEALLGVLRETGAERQRVSS